MKENKFIYKYTAPTEAERKEIDSIRKQYAEDKEESKLDRLRSLHAKVKNGAKAISLTIGILGCLIFGLGLTMILEWSVLLWGVVVSAVGGAAMLIAYPVYTWVLQSNKKKYGEEIVRLSEELLQGKE